MPNHWEHLHKLLRQVEFPLEAFHIHKRFQGRELLAFGAGECCHWFVEIVMKIHGYRPSLILDRRFRRGDSFEGIPALSPLEFQPSEAQRESAIAVICVGNARFAQEIQEHLESQGFLNIIHLRDIYEVHNPFSDPSELQKQGFAYYHNNETAILAALELFQDPESQEVYTGCLETHLSRRPVELPQRPRKEQYFPKDVPLQKGYSRFVCCGCYDGDTVRLLQEVVGKVEDIVCFEPEAHLFARLADNMRRNASTYAKRVICLPCAVHREERRMRFASGSGLGSRLAEWGDAEVQSVCLDHALPGFEPTFICMDIEGAELPALQGGEQTLRAHRPDLGVCVYHAPNQLWEVPLYLHSLGLGYRFYLRNYTGFTQETVLYATV